jgi:hypothetical protein
LGALWVGRAESSKHKLQKAIASFFIVVSFREKRAANDGLAAELFSLTNSQTAPENCHAITIFLWPALAAPDSKGRPPHHLRWREVDSPALKALALAAVVFGTTQQPTPNRFLLSL